MTGACAGTGTTVPTPPSVAPSAPAAPPSDPRPLEHTMATETTITETTMGDAGDLRVGVSNVWESEFTGADGAATRGPTAMLSVADHAGQDLHRSRVHAGSEVTVSGHRLIVRRVHAPDSGLGSVTLAVETPAEIDAR